MDLAKVLSNLSEELDTEDISLRTIFTLNYRTYYYLSHIQHLVVFLAEIYFFVLAFFETEVTAAALLFL